MNNQETKTAILASIVEYVGKQVASGCSATELMGQNECFLPQLNSRFGANTVREVLREMVGETSSPLLASLCN